MVYAHINDGGCFNGITIIVAIINVFLGLSSIIRSMLRGYELHNL